jgi:single-stranded-DNA-specific exonuclease
LDTWTISHCSHDEASSLAGELEISETTARILVRRGYGDPDAARSFLEGAPPRHDPFLLGDMAGAVEAIKRALGAGRRICVHGDYDADGICATALAVLVLRELGAEVEWHLPSRFEEGYGVQRETLARLAEEGCGLVLTVDCGITAVEEIAGARAQGLEVVVTDHHRPGETLPDCPVVATRPSDYPFPELCGTGVVYKLGEALLGPGHEALTRHLDLVAVATISDVVPLVDENRALALAGLRGLARTQKRGLRALMKAARVDPARVDEGAVGFRLAPRINAAGRLCRPGAALELLLTEDSDEAGRLALAKVDEWPEAKQRRRGYVLADEGWHEGVIGIVASRLVERFHRPVVLIAGAGEEWKGSGRSTGPFDLHGGLAACVEHLERFGGHRAAAGLSIRPENVEAFARAFATHADAELTEDDLRVVTRVDAVVSGAELTLELCSELRRLAPFGLGNPGVTLLLPSCELGELAPVGNGKHLRFRVRDRGRDAGNAIAFGLGAQLDRYRTQGRYDVVFRLEENHWNGTVAPQLVVRRVLDAPEGYESLREWLAQQWKLDDGERSAEARAVFADLGLSGETSGRRQLLESEVFRALLEEPALPRAA